VIVRLSKVGVDPVAMIQQILMAYHLPVEEMTGRNTHTSVHTRNYLLLTLTVLDVTFNSIDNCNRIYLAEAMLSLGWLVILCRK